MLHSITHQTVFDFETTPRSVVQRLHLTPFERPYQKVLEWDVAIKGGAIELETDDYHGNRVQLCHHDMKSTRIEITCRGRVDVSDTSGVAGEHDTGIPLTLYRNPTGLTKPGPRLQALAREMGKAQESRELEEIDTLHELSARVLDGIKYKKGKTDTSTSAEAAMELGAGVCQDHVHVFTSAARLLGFPARYVSGYLMMDDTPVQEATHAWAEIHVDALGWVGFDISNAISPDTRYVKLATGFDYLDVTPISGVRFGSAEERLSTQIKVSQQ